MLKKVNASLFLVDLIMNVPIYDKFLKEIMSDKGKFKEGVVQLSKNCSCVKKNVIFIPKSLRIQVHVPFHVIYGGNILVKPCVIWVIELVLCLFH